MLSVGTLWAHGRAPRVRNQEQSGAIRCNRCNHCACLRSESSQGGSVVEGCARARRVEMHVVLRRRVARGERRGSAKEDGEGREAKASEGERRPTKVRGEKRRPAAESRRAGDGHDRRDCSTGSSELSNLSVVSIRRWKAVEGQQSLWEAVDDHLQQRVVEPLGHDQEVLAVVEEVEHALSGEEAVRRGMRRQRATAGQLSRAAPQSASQADDAALASACMQSGSWGVVAWGARMRAR